MVQIVNPKNGLLLARFNDYLSDSAGNRFAIHRGVPRIAEGSNYSENFGVQWNKFGGTQLDRENEGLNLSCRRFFAETQWDCEELSGQDILEVGSGAGRFSRVILERTKGRLYSIDYSDAVTANIKNNGHIAPERFHLFQASIYEMPFPDSSFDKVFCLGVLQHTPNFDASIKALVGKAKPGGQIVVDFYPIKGWWTKISAKYILRPLTKRMPHARLLRIIERNIDWLLRAHFFLHGLGLGVLARFLPVCNAKESFPKLLSNAELRQWAILDTFDQYSPQHDHPQRIRNVMKMFERHGARVTFAGFVPIGDGMSGAVVRAVKCA